MGDRKIYDAKLHKDVEIAETIKIKEIFSKTDIEIVQHPFGDYDIDIGLKLVNQPVGLIEVENRKDSWQRGDFPSPLGVKSFILGSSTGKSFSGTGTGPHFGQ